MAEQRTNFILGFGENLTEPVDPTLGGGPSKPAYTVDEAKERLLPMAGSTAAEFDELPDAACPNNEAVAVVTLHPQSLSKSAFPGRLLQEAKLSSVGSRPDRITPDAWSRKVPPFETETTSLFVSAERSAFRQWTAALGGWTERTSGAADLAKVERLRAGGPVDRLRVTDEEAEPLLEVALHAGPARDDILEAFEAYAIGLGMRPDLDRRLYAGQLCFLPVRGVRDRLVELGWFSFLRVARTMPTLRAVSSVLRSAPGAAGTATLPDAGPLDPSLRAAVFDGGLTAGTPLSRWATAHELPGTGAPHPGGPAHGADVCSALLFGHLEDGAEAPRPYGHADVFRVLDETDADEDLFDVVPRMRDVLQSGRHPFVNISIGPKLPIEDDEVHTWTSVLDELLSGGDRLATVAVGNDGEGDSQLGLNRVQVPSDCVNAVAVGAADRPDGTYLRAPYSSVGPGRSPGLIKPEVLAFGGSRSTPFNVVDGSSPGSLTATAGTSFASPAALRTAMGVRAHFGDQLSPLALRALLVHAAEGGEHDRHEVGWGRIPADLGAVVTCGDDTARIVYQGELLPRQYLKARIPLPAEQLAGMVTLKATLCYATKIDPAHPGSYTRSGMDICFYPHDGKTDPNSTDPSKLKSRPFFRLREFSTEQELRRDAHKWETTLHRSDRMRGSSLSNPSFTIHYNAREAGQNTSAGERVRYALVVSVTANSERDLYNRIVRRYQTQIRPLSPVIQIPVRAGA